MLKWRFRYPPPLNKNIIKLCFIDFNDNIGNHTNGYTYVSMRGYSATSRMAPYRRFALLKRVRAASNSDGEKSGQGVSIKSNSL